MYECMNIYEHLNEYMLNEYNIYYILYFYFISTDIEMG